MTATHHAPNFHCPASDYTNEASKPQSSLNDNSNATKTTRVADSLTTTVSSVVDGMVDTAVSTATLQAEKRNVQTLINKLVSRVREDAAKEANGVSAKAENPKKDSENQGPVGGVAVGDHRQRKCENLPVIWTQTMDSITLTVDVPPSVRKQQVSVEFTPGSVKAAVKESSSSLPALLIHEALVAEIAVDGCMWALEEEGSSTKLIIEIEKSKVQWWARLFMADDPKDYRIVTPRPAPRPTRVSDSCTPLPSDNVVRSGDSVRGLSGESGETRQERAEVETGEASDSNLQDSVASFVDEVIEAAASGSQVSSQRRSDSASGERRNERPTLRQQRVLTRADIPKMVEQCKKIIAEGGAGAGESALQLATFYHHGLGVEHNDAEAARLYKYALENGILDPSAAFQLGLIYNQGAPGLEPNPIEAVRWWRVSASLRNPVAMFNLGVMYMNGSGCDMDPIMATRWFQQAQALDPRLQPPQFSRTQLEEKIATAMKLKKERMKRALPPEEKKRRKELALKKVRMLAYGSAAIVGLSVSVVALRYWWRNRL